MSSAAAHPTADWTTGRLAAAIGAECEGAADVSLRKVAPLDGAAEGDLAFCSGGRWVRGLATTRASAVLVGPKLEVPAGVVAIRCVDAREAYARAAALLLPLPWPEPGIHPAAQVHPSATVAGATIDALAVIEAGATIAPGAWVQSHAFVGSRSRIGKRARLMPHAVVMEDCTVGERVWLQPGAVIGADGFGHVLSAAGVVRVPQLGTVVLEDDVEVGANACVDRAALGETRVGRGSRLDNLVQVAHGVRIGAECLLAAFAGVAGSARLGDRVVMAGRTAVVDGIDVGDGARFAGLASASKDVPAGAVIGGSPARKYRQWLRETAAVKQLPALIRQVARLERRAMEDDRDRP
ncbi:MAG: UDP-3-O-[3-hydroxymyristoyl] glucosamine N-acyltransferase [Myxococcota bacterium]